MDRIDKFIKAKPTRKTRHIRHKGKDILVHKKEVRTIRKYKQNKCLDPTLNLYQKYNTKWSKLTMEKGLELKSGKVDQTRLNHYLERVKNYTPKPQKKEIPVIDLWEKENQISIKHKINKFELPRKPINGLLSEQKFTNAFFDEYLDKLNQKYFIAKEKKIDTIEKLLPRLPDKSKIDYYPQEVAVSYKFNFEVDILEISTDKFAISSNNYIEVYEFRNFHRILMLKTTGKIENLIITENYVAYSIENCVYIKEFDVKYTTTDYQLNIFQKNKKNSRNAKKDLYLEEIIQKHKSENDDKKNTENEFESQFMRLENNTLVIEHASKIVKMCSSKNGKHIALIACRKVYIHNIEKHKSSQPIKLKTEIPLNLLIINTTLYISTTVKLICHNLNGNKDGTDFFVPLLYVHTFGFNKNYTISANRDKRIAVESKGKIIKYMEQEKDILEIAVHRKHPLFLVAFSDEISLFYGKVTKNHDFEAIILKKWNGRYRNLHFHRDIPWFYASNGCKVQMFT
ncbi:hypothetical protein EDEG_02477 [Edhazardia aedis USNM 41457]|uniref:Uncharacterized protein n=1 Tax=Edhazardia aedis (strain USNM 41457) TaxID=1003232 RepID=J9DPA5_EDHAE|nr:hypothetical protein EDEG_02477 [Edhazardia aedis USNM 41457]|eukprot:EJW03172.1 hypothetical protein EDEG_02477 [Edhazardia aedis USNM 41457]